MRKIIVSMMVSADGLIEGPGHDINWHRWDGEMDRYMAAFFNTVDTIILGRVAYQLMESFWPTPAAEGENAIIAHCMNNLLKLVYSGTLPYTTWNNAVLMGEVNQEELEYMKQQPGKNMVIFGGADIIASFRRLDLIDEYRLIVNPVILGTGKPLFGEGIQPLELLQSRTFGNGNVLLHYKPTAL